MQIPDELRVYFWDVSVFVIARLLNEGNHKALIWLFKVYDEHKIEDTVRTARDLTVKTARCLQNYFDLKEDELCCFESPGFS